MLTKLRTAFHNLSLRTKILLSYLLLSVVCMVPFFVVSTNRATALSESNTVYSAQQALDQATEYLNFRMTSLLQANFAFAYGKNMASFMVQDPDALSISEQFSLREQMSEMILGIQVAYPGTISGITLYVNDRFRFASMQSDYYRPYSEMEASEWYRNMRSRNVASAFIPPEWNRNGDCVSVVHLISDPQNYAVFVGAMVIDTPARTVNEILRKATVTPGSYCYLVTESGVTAGRSDARLVTEMPDAVAAALAGDGTYLDGQHRVAVRRLPVCDWLIVQVIPESDLSEVRYSQVRVFVVCAAVVMIAAVGLSLLTSRTVTARINMLSGRMRAFHFENESPIQIPTGGDDIDHLIDSYNMMVAEIKKLTAENIHKGQQINETELAMLHAQINPHFLFNTLDMIRYLADHNENRKISAAMTALASFYRRSLNGGNPDGTIGNELAHVRAYMELQNLRFDGCVSLHIDVPPALHDAVLPAVTLQPLVENALLHGVLGRADKRGDIFITGTRDGTDILLTVRDNGCGIPPDRMASLFGGDRMGSGVGLRNTHARLRIRFGAGYGLSVDSVLGEYTAITARIRAETAPRAAGRPDKSKRTEKEEMKDADTGGG